ncbi:MAG: RecQ family ATP-dependent DNA helicase [Planctomycetota bacterium]
MVRGSDVFAAQDPSVTTNPAGDPLAVLRDRFGMESFRDGQKAVIDRLLAGRNVAAVFPTGGGKSLCYQLPALMLPGTTVIVSPLIALMKDQCDALAARGIRAARLDSTLTPDEFRDAMAGIRDGWIKMLYVAPERFFNERFLASMGRLDVSLFAIDEAHCISQWGHNFRPDYLKLTELVKDLGADRVLALTATATPEVLGDIRDAFAIEDDDAIRTPFYRKNLHLRSTVVTSGDAESLLIDRISGRPRGATLVYVTQQKTAIEVAESITAAGFPARGYHAGLKKELRDEIQHEFLSSANAIVVATIAFGMGIDKPDIRYVYHINPSRSLESYAQEIGRAGRDGELSICETLLVPDDRIVLENFVYGDTPSRHAVRMMVDRIAGQAETFHISHYSLSGETDIRPLVLRTLLTYLELDGYIKATSPRYDTYKVKPLVTSKSILSNFQGEPRQFLANLLGCLSKGRTWFLLNVAASARKLNCERERILRAIDHLASRGWIEVQTSGLVHGYRRLRPIADAKILADDYFARLDGREATEVQRIDQVFDLVRATQCQAATLSAHFGETLDEPCGNCSACIGDGPYEIPEAPVRSIGSSAKRALDDAIKEYPDQLVSVRDQARFLCGLSSPSFTRSRLTRKPSYGVCDRIPFQQVLKQLQE